MQLPSISLPFRRIAEPDQIRPTTPVRHRLPTLPDNEADLRAQHEAETLRYLRSKGILDTFLHFGTTPTYRR